MENFAPGKVIPTVSGSPLTIKKHMAEGGQGHVYLVDFEGKDRVLKWYKPSKITSPDKFYQNLNDNARRGAPDSHFLWPITATERVEGSFGYVMELRNQGYFEFTDFLMDYKNVRFTTYKANAEACLRIVSAFRLLHQNGYSYQDMNHGNFFINPQTGDVLICDNDNVAPNNKDTFIFGTPRYMAPELVAPEILGRDERGKVKKVRPSMATDYWSLSVVLFMILCMNHPLEGKRWLDATVLTPANERVVYGSRATFIFDPEDDTNRPNCKIHKNVLKRFPYLPSYLSDAFMRAFSQDSIKNPGRRLREIDWMKVLVRFQSEIKRCHKCGGEVFIDGAHDAACDVCGNVQHIDRKIRFSEYVVPASKGVRIYRCQLESCNAEDALTRVGTIVTNPSRPELFFRNDCGLTLEGITAKGTIKPIAPDSVVPVKPGIRINAFNGSFAFE